MTFAVTDPLSVMQGTLWILLLILFLSCCILTSENSYLLREKMKRGSKEELEDTYQRKSTKIQNHNEIKPNEIVNEETIYHASTTLTFHIHFVRHFSQDFNILTQKFVWMCNCNNCVLLDYFFVILLKRQI
eukprot:TRINITY_DN4204_c0_g1_i10.p1 TRINITY_DN4204_c0_g1~~TRINITY_DN4204_c0_g1_i10.p1  ORF type:complete len:131 (+),score=12.65 TRINITY_DN4204_c0_g1_i10:85-477(+)